MNEKKPSQVMILFLFLVVTGIGFSIYQYKMLSVSLNPAEQKDVWRLSMRFDTESQPDKAAKLKILIPDLKKSAILDQDISAIGFGKSISKQDNNKVVTLSKGPHQSESSVFYRAYHYVQSMVSSDDQVHQTVIYNLTLPVNAETKPLAVPDVQEQENRLKQRLDNHELFALENLESHVAKKSADKVTFIRQAILLLPEVTTSEIKTRLNNAVSDYSQAHLLSEILTLHDIPNTVLNVMPYQNRLKMAPSELPVWIAAYINNQWQYFDTSSGKQMDPTSALILYSGDNRQVESVGSHIKKTRLSFSQQSIGQAQYQAFQNDSVHSALYEFSLFNLPAHTQQTYKIILMIPLGVLVILILRIMVGIPTIGTFMPVLIALSFRDTTLLLGIMFFIIVVAIGLIFRKYFESLKLLTVPRLGIILTIVVLTLMAIAIMTNKMGLHSGLSVTLFPMVILTMAIERISILWEERGANEALTTAAGSLFSATLIYLFIFNDALEYLFFTFPGLLLVVMGLMLLIGRYRGYRLSELFRFNALINNKDKS